MKCPVCQVYVLFLGHNRFGSQISHCGQCGRVWQGAKEFVPAQAKSHAALREACEAVDAHLKTTYPPYPDGGSPYDKVRAALTPDREEW